MAGSTAGASGGQREMEWLTLSLRKNELTYTVVPPRLPSGAPRRATGKAKGCRWAERSGLALPPTSHMALAGPEIGLGLRLFLCKLGQIRDPSPGCWEASRSSGQ